MRRNLLSFGAALLALSVLSGCSGDGDTTSNTGANASPVGHRWIVKNENGLLCYDNSDDLETARGMDRDFEDLTPLGFHNTGDESAGGRLTQGDIISITSSGGDYYIVSPIRAAVANERKECAVDISSLKLSEHNADKERIASWTIGTTYKGKNEIAPCFETSDLASAQYDAEVSNDGTGNGDKSLHVSDDPGDPARYRLQQIEEKVLTFYVVEGTEDITIRGYTQRSPHTGETIYCAHENKPQP